MKASITVWVKPEFHFLINFNDIIPCGGEDPLVDTWWTKGTNEELRACSLLSFIWWELDPDPISASEQAAAFVGAADLTIGSTEQRCEYAGCLESWDMGNDLLLCDPSKTILIL